MPNFFLSHKRMKVPGVPGASTSAAAPPVDLRQPRRDPVKGLPESATNLRLGR
jgi:hypothetical protein